MDNDLEKGLRAKGRRLTRPRRAILKVLQEAASPVRASDIHERLRRSRISIDLVTVYRNLATLKNLGLITHVLFEDNQMRYELLRGRTHHHHIRCRVCGRVVDLRRCPVETTMTRGIERSTRFIVEDHALEFSGTCPECQTD